MGSFLDIQVRVDFALLRDYLLGGDGLRRDVLGVVGCLSLCVAASGLQLAWPSSFPELPFYPAVLVSCSLFMCRGRMAPFWPVLCGFLLDCWSYGAIGVSSLFLVLCCHAHSAICRFCSRRLLPAVTLALANFAAVFCWTFLMLVFKASGQDWGMRLALVPRELLLASMLAVPIGSLMHFKGCCR